jgi:hypothetical protein
MVSFIRFLLLDAVAIRRHNCIAIEHVVALKT